MYTVQGELTISRDPESLIGFYGIPCVRIVPPQASESSEAIDTYKGFAVDTNKLVANFITRSLHRGRGGVNENIEPERITSLEQAERYALPTRREVNVSKYRKPDLSQLLYDQVPERAELLEGSANLWKERRLPTPYIYVKALGELVAQVVYSPEQGWNNTHENIWGRRSITGIAISGLYITKTREGIEPLFSQDFLSRLSTTNDKVTDLFARSAALGAEEAHGSMRRSTAFVFSKTQERFAEIAQLGTGVKVMSRSATIFPCTEEEGVLKIARRPNSPEERKGHQIYWGLTPEGIRTEARTFGSDGLEPEQALGRIYDLVHAQDLEVMSLDDTLNRQK